MIVHEMRMSRAFMALLAGAVVLSTSGCPNLSRDLDLKAQIQGDVLEANAEQIAIRVQPEAEVMGVTSPSGPSTAKVGVAFPISTTVSPEYAFLRWEQGGGDGEVVFADATKTETEATITRKGTGILIVARFDARPAVIIKDPDGGEGILRNRRITITFSEPVDPSTVSFETISVEERPRNNPAAPLESVADRLALSVNQAVVMISLKDVLQYDPQNYIWVKITKNIKDLAGNMMKEDFSWYFITGNYADVTNPVLTSFSIKDGATVLPADARTKTKLGLTLETVVADDGVVTTIRVTETALTDMYGAPITGVQTVTDWGYDPSLLYDLQTTVDGQKKIEVRVFDSMGHPSDEIPFSTIILDTTVPIFSSAVLINGGAAATANPAVTLAISASDAGGSIGEYQLSESAAFVAGPTTTAWTAWTPTPSFALSSGDGSKTVYVRLKDLAGNISAESALNNDSITLDTTAPAFTSAVAINGGAASTTSTLVSLAISAADALSGTVEYRLSQSATFLDSPAWTPWTGSPQTAPFTLSVGDGSKNVYAQLKDAAGNVSTESAFSHDSISLDQEAPIFSSAVQINSGTAATYNPVVALGISASDAGSAIAEYQLSEDPAFLDPTTTLWTLWGGSPQTAPFTLSAGDGTKTVYARLRDENAHISTPVVDDRDSITLDTALPTFFWQVLINSGVATTTSRNVSLTIDATDALSGIEVYQLSESATFADSPAWTPWTVSPQTAPFTLSIGDELKTVYVRLRDAAGNLSTDAVLNNDSVTLDTAVPTFSSQVQINGGAATTTDAAVILTIDATDALTGMDAYRLSESSTFADSPAWTDWTSSPQSAPFTLSAGDGSKTVYAQLKDNAGNLSTDTTLNHASISLDLAPPVFSSQTFINSGATTTTSRDVSLAISASDAGSSIVQYQLSEDPAFLDSTTTVWRTWNGSPQTAPFTLSLGDGSKNVYARLKDASENVSTETAFSHDSISLDQEAPTFSDQVKINNGDAATNDPDVDLTINASDAGSSIVEYRLSEDAAFLDPTTTVWRAWTPPYSFTLSTGDGTKTVYVQLKDASGHVSTEATLNHDSITLDTTPPQITGVLMSDTPNKNKYAYVTFNEDIFGDAAKGPLATNALKVIPQPPSAADVQSVSTTRTGSKEATVEITWKPSKEPAEYDWIRVETNGATAIYDALGNAMAGAVGDKGQAKHLSILLPPPSAKGAAAKPSSTAGAGRPIQPLALTDRAPEPPQPEKELPRAAPSAPQQTANRVEPLAQFHRPVVLPEKPKAEARDDGAPGAPNAPTVAETADRGSPMPVARGAGTAAPAARKSEPMIALPDADAVPEPAEQSPEARRASSIPMVGVFILGAVLLLIFGWFGAAFLRGWSSRR